MAKVKVVHSLDVKPNGEHILVKLCGEVDEKTSGGIIVPQSSMQNKKTADSIIVAVGEGRRDPSDPSKRIPMDCKVGDHVLHALFIGYPMVIKGEDFMLIKHNDILAFLDEKSTVVEGEEALKVDIDKVYD